MGAGDRDGREGAAWKRRLAARGWCDEDARPEDEACDAVVDGMRHTGPHTTAFAW
jgi:hypothetical protein